MKDKKSSERILTTLLVLLPFLILLFDSIVVLAGTTVTYNPPQRRKVTKSRTTTSGSRGCNNPSLFNAKAHLFAPEDHVGLTTSSHPTFFWYVETDSAVKVRFTLVEPGVAKPIVDLQQTVLTSGIGRLHLPQELPQLTQGKVYRWTVALICNPKRPSQNAYAYSFIERVPQPIHITQYLKVDDTKRASIYAQEEIWYDALAEAYLSNSNPQQFLGMAKQIERVSQN